MTFNKTPFCGGGLDPEVTLLCKHLLNEGDTVLDVGAHVGIHSIMFSKLVSASGQVFAFEPTDYTYKQLNTNKLLNRAFNLTLVNCAIGEKSGTVEMH